MISYKMVGHISAAFDKFAREVSGGDGYWWPSIDDAMGAKKMEIVTNGGYHYLLFESEDDMMCFMLQYG